MPINEMAQKILELKGYGRNTYGRDKAGLDIIAQKIGTTKKQIFSTYLTALRQFLWSPYLK